METALSFGSDIAKSYHNDIIIINEETTSTIKVTADDIYEKNREHLGESQTRPVRVSKYGYLYYVEQFWKDPLNTKFMVLNHPGLPYIESITNTADYDIWFCLNDNEFVVKSNSIEKFDLNMAYLVFTNKLIKLIPINGLIDYDEALNLLRERLRDGFGSIQRYWNTYINEFISNENYGICYDAPVVLDISKDMPPIIDSKLSITNDLLMDDFDNTNIDIRNYKDYTTLTKTTKECDKRGCMAMHYNTIYSLTETQIINREKINSKTISYSDLCDSWNKFYEDKLSVMVDKFVDDNKHKHELIDNKILFPINIIGNKICDVTGDFRKEEHYPNGKMWRNYFLKDGTLIKM